jgi:hypothetical protein
MTKKQTMKRPATATGASSNTVNQVVKEMVQKFNESGSHLVGSQNAKNTEVYYDVKNSLNQAELTMDLFPAVLAKVKEGLGMIEEKVNPSVFNHKMPIRLQALHWRKYCPVLRQTARGMVDGNRLVPTICRLAKNS